MPVARYTPRLHWHYKGIVDTIKGIMDIIKGISPGCQLALSGNFSTRIINRTSWKTAT